MFVYRLYQNSVLDSKSSVSQESRVGSHAAQFTSVIELPSKCASGVYTTTSGPQDATDTNSPTANTSATLEFANLSYTAFRGTEDLGCDDDVCKAEGAGDELPV